MTDPERVARIAGDRECLFHNFQLFAIENITIIKGYFNTDSNMNFLNFFLGSLCSWSFKST